MTRSRWIVGCCVVALLAGGMVSAAAGSPVQELTKMMPDDVMAFIATSGGDAIQGDFEHSILGRIANDPSMQEFVKTVETQLTGMAAEEGQEEMPKFVFAGLQYAEVVLSRPMVIGVAGAEVEDGPPICVFAIIDAGPRKAEFVAILEQIEQAIGKDDIADIQIGSLKMRGSLEDDDVSVYWGWVGNTLVAAGNDVQRAVVKYVTSPRAAAGSYLDKLPDNGDALAVYYDYRKLLGLAEMFAGEEEEFGVIKTALTELGVTSIGSLAARVGFSGGDLVTDSFVSAPGPRRGLLAMDKPIDMSWFGRVDSRAVVATAMNFDLSGFFEMVMNTAKTVSPDEVYPAIQAGIEQIGTQLGFDIRDDLLATVAGPVVAYALPAGTMIEAPSGGGVILIDLTDGARFEKSLATLEQLGGSLAQGMLQIGTQQDEAGRTMHVWSSPALAVAQVMPTWCVVGNQAIIGSNMALCQMGIEKVTSGGAVADSLLNTEGFRKATAQLPSNLTSLTYADSRTQFTQTMIQLQQLWPLAVMAAQEQGLKLPVMLPSLGSIIRDMEPSCEYGYATADGFYTHYQGSGIEVGLRSVAGAALGAGMMMPALARTRQLAFRMTSGTNLSGIGKACLIYANDYEDEFPPNLEALIDTVELSPKSLESKLKPAGSDEPSYIYIAGQTTAMDPRNVIAYDNPAFCSEGVNVLFLDSHVEFMEPDEFRRALEATYRRLGRKMPEIEFGEGSRASILPRTGRDNNRVTETKAQLRTLDTALDIFMLDVGRYPTEEEGLVALVEQPAGVDGWRGPYIKATEVPADAWGREFIYDASAAGGRSAVVKSLGRDGAEGGSGYDADILSTN